MGWLNMMAYENTMSLLRPLNAVRISGKEVLPIVEGGKGVSVSNGRSAGAFAAADGVGTFSAVNADRYDAEGNPVPILYHGTTRRQRHEELVQMGIEAGITQAGIAHETAKGGPVHMNILWEMGGAQRVLRGILEGAKGCITGVTCGAGMPYKVAEMASEFHIYYYPIVSSMRAFRALWKRAYYAYVEWLGAVVYEDPWLAGGHNGLSNSEDPNAPENPYQRVVLLRQFMTEVGLAHVPIIMAGGVWWLKEWEHWLNNPEIGPVAFQFGTRPIVTQESPVSDAWKRKLLTLQEGDVFLNRFSPTGFYSSAVNNHFIQELRERSERQISYGTQPEGERAEALPLGPRGRPIYITLDDYLRAQQWIHDGYDVGLKTPDDTVIFVTQEQATSIHTDQVDCMGCLSMCRFSNWQDHGDYTTHKRADPRSFCIQKTLQQIAHGAEVDNELMFSGHNAYRFAQDPFYEGGFIPTVKQLVQRIQTGY